MLDGSSTPSMLRTLGTRPKFAEAATGGLAPSTSQILGVLGPGLFWQPGLILALRLFFWLVAHLQSVGRDHLFVHFIPTHHLA